MTRNIEGRLTRLEQVKYSRGAACLLLDRPDETEEQAKARYRAEHPGSNPAVFLIIDMRLSEFPL